MNGLQPDIETASPDYASRFTGAAGEYLLSVQSQLVGQAIEGYAGGSLLEVGGGHGQLVSLYEELRFAYMIQGSDIKCFQHALKHLPTSQCTICDMRTMPFSDSSFDVVVAVRLMTHHVEWKAVLREMCRVARRAIVIDYPTGRSLNALTPMLFGVKKSIERNTRTYTNFSTADFVGPLENSGFTIDWVANQFFLPMVVHRLLRGHFVAVGMERAFSSLGLTKAFGSPALLRATARSVTGRHAATTTGRMR